MASQRVALIVVHGVADQQPGETARALGDLMVATEGGHGDRQAAEPAVDYVAVASEDLVLTIEPLAPRQAGRRRLDASPRVQDRSLEKEWQQSRRSEFHAAPAKAAAGGADRGIALTDYLLAEHRDNGAGPEAYGTRCIRIERRQAGETREIDLYEMYWADLSRLSGALPRIVTEMFTMVFRLSKLGRDTVNEAFNASPERQASLAWRCVRGTQVALDWLFANVLALLFAQLFLLAQVFLGLGLATLAAHRPLVHVAAASIALVLGAMVFAYERRGSLAEPGRWAPPFLVAFAGLLALALPAVRPWVSAAVLLAVITYVYDVTLGVGAERFPLVRVVGRAMWALLLAVMLASAVKEAIARPGSADSFDIAYHAALFGVELTLLAIKWWWVAAGVLLVVWWFSALAAMRAPSFESRASLATGRLGLVASLASFLTLTMAIWALLTTVIDASVRNVRYSPCIFSLDEKATGDWLAGHARPVAAASAPAYAPAPNICLWQTAAQRGNSGSAASLTSARVFLADRYINSTTGFSVLAVVLLMLAAYLSAMFTPSVLAELKLLALRATEKAHDRVLRHRRRAGMAAGREGAAERVERIRRLGRWLTAGFRRLDAAVLAVSLVAVLLGASFAGIYFLELAGDLKVAEVTRVDDTLKAVSQSLLEPLVLTTAGLVALLSVLGGLLSKYLPELRAPLDVALDVDNHFREFPRTGIPRARIFSRYAALLRHVGAQGYDRIVIVSHSQGTVITADLLRFLSSPDGAAPVAPQQPRLDGSGLPPIRCSRSAAPCASSTPRAFRRCIDGSSHGAAASSARARATSASRAG